MIKVRNQIIAKKLSLYNAQISINKCHIPVVFVDSLAEVYHELCSGVTVNTIPIFFTALMMFLGKKMFSNYPDFSSSIRFHPLSNFSHFLSLSRGILLVCEYVSFLRFLSH